jgi:hypothetical protein
VLLGENCNSCVELHDIIYEVCHFNFTDFVTYVIFQCISISKKDCEFLSTFDSHNANKIIDKYGSVTKTFSTERVSVFK